jgi:simple sugar transport system permease protein
VTNDVTNATGSASSPRVDVPNLPDGTPPPLPTDGDEFAWSRALRNAAVPVVRFLMGLALSLAVVGAILLALGNDPVAALRSIIDGALGSEFRRGQTVTVIAPLLLAGLAAAIPFSARLWNVGGEGQMAIGGVAAVLVALNLGGLDSTLLVVLAVLAGTIAGGCWGLLPGVLKVRFGANEVIVCLMLNFIALLVVSLVVSGEWKSYSAQTVAIPERARISQIGWLPGANWGVALAVGAVVVAALLMLCGTLGFKIRAMGLNERTARLNGIRVGRVAAIAFTLGGMFAGLAGAIEVTGKSHALVQGFTANIGFLGIAIALVARLNPIAILPTAMVFGIVTVGGNNLKAAEGIDPSLSTVLIATLVLVLLAAQVLDVRRKN